MNTIFYWIALNSVHGISDRVYKKLIDYFKTPERVFKASKRELLNIDGIGDTLASSIIDFNEWEKVNKELELIERYGVKTLTLNSPEYPKNLLNIYDPPPLLYIKGDIIKEDDVALAIVGSRMTSNYGRITAERISKELALNGITVISGFARGIDSIAHKGALSANGRTIAVLGSGIDIIYPKENKGLFSDIINNGAVITEFSMGTKPHGFNFPKRNRIISGLSLGVLVIEAAERSGSLITANYALEQGREVFAIPGNPLFRTSKGTNKLIKEGAKLVESVDDILEEITPDIKKKVNMFSEKERDLSEREKNILSILSYEPTHIDNIVKITGVMVNEILSILLKLEIEGLIKQLPGKFFIKNG
jgi:DNA processing protein